MNPKAQSEISNTETYRRKHRQDTLQNIAVESDFINRAELTQEIKPAFDNWNLKPTAQ